MMTTREMRYTAQAMLVGVLAVALSGCTLANTAGPLPEEMAGGTSGRLMGGNQPISGSTVYLVQVGTTGYGSGNATPVIAQAVSDAAGNFSLPGHTCSSATGLTMIEAKGGNPGLTAGTNNSAIYMAALLGPCSGVTSSTFININEVTTVAAAYVVRPFASGNNVGSSGSSFAGLANGMALYNNLVNNVTGTTPGANVPAGMQVPSTTINALANSLAACVNSVGPASPACASLFTSSGVANTGLTANTFNIAVAIASMPASNVAAIFNVAGSAPPFQPTLTSAPSDWMLPVVYTGGNLTSQQTAVSIDLDGYAWVATLGGYAGTLESVSPTGVMTSSGQLNGTIDTPTALVFDQGENLYVVSGKQGNASVIKASPSSVFGKALYLPAFTVRSSILVTPGGAALDYSKTLVVTDPGALDVYRIDPTNGSITTDQKLASNSFHLPLSPPLMCADSVMRAGVLSNSQFSGSIQIENITSSSLVGSVSFNGDSSGGAHPTYRVAFDGVKKMAYSVSSGGLYAATTFGSSASSYATFPNDALSLVVDGLGQVWFGMSGGPNRVNRFSPLLAGSTGSFVPNPSGNPQPVSDIAIDTGGNVWLGNGGSGGLVELIGAAAPVFTPVINDALFGQGARP